MTDKSIDDVIKHAVMANHDGEVKSIVVIMIANGDPEVHMAIDQGDAFAMNAAIDMFKVEMLRILADRATNKKARE